MELLKNLVYFLPYNPEQRINQLSRNILSKSLIPFSEFYIPFSSQEKVRMEREDHEFLLLPGFVFIKAVVIIIADKELVT